VHNDTYALLRAGTDHGWGVALVCGAGINCLGVAPDGRVARFLALGDYSGDWGGGYALGLEALGASVRQMEGRGPRTVLAESVAVHFGLDSPIEVAEALHLGRISGFRLVELAPLVCAAADGGDPVAVGLVERLAGEIGDFVGAAVRRLGLEEGAVDVVLGGGVMRAGCRRLDEPTERAVLAVAPLATVIRTPHLPILGAALLALDELGAAPAAHDHVREGLADAGLDTPPAAVSV
jgi:N-acetylglucosamine kinase-like BadF-type ATPase